MRAKTTICSGLQLHQQRHEQALALDAFHLAVPEDLLKKHPFVCNMLVDDPQSIVAGGQNEGLAKLAERLERAETVEGGGCLFGFDQGGGCGGVIRVSCCAVGVWATFAGDWDGTGGKRALAVRSRPAGRSSVLAGEAGRQRATRREREKAHAGSGGTVRRRREAAGSESGARRSRPPGDRAARRRHQRRAGRGL